MRILVTGNSGLVGRAVEKQLTAEGDEVVGFDLANGQDIRDAPAIREAGRGCDAVVHLAALLGRGESGEETLRTNVLGTWNVLESARANGLGRVISMSSVDALGIFKGEGLPDYFPIDDDLPCRPKTPYGISKKLIEEMGQTFSQATGIPTICLRPPGVWDEQTYHYIVEKRRERPEYEWDPYWEYGAFIDVRDLASLVSRCLRADFAGFGCYLATADDITTSGGTSLSLALRICPQVPWKSQEEYKEEPYRSLVDCRRVKEAFGWQPKFTWGEFIRAGQAHKG